jgi:transcriptional regulator with XRE-family HTH domain
LTAYTRNFGGNFSQEALADLAGLHRNYISEIECGMSSPTLGALEQIADALGMSAWALLKRMKD